METKSNYTGAMSSTSLANTSGSMERGAGGFLIGFLAGIVAAGVLAMLYAPKSGYETRTMLKNEVSETQRMFQNWGNDIRERADRFGRIIRFSSSPDMEMQPTGNGHQEDRQTG